MKRRVPFVAGMLLLLLADALTACSVPVFRYALEHWRPDAYVAVVFHRGALTDEQQALLAAMQPRGQDDAQTANLVVQTVDLDAEPDEAMRLLWEEQATETLPWIVVNTPLRQGLPTTVWAGELTGDNQQNLMSSPVREQLSQRLLSGDSIVWVVLDSGQAEADNAAFELVTAEVERLEGELELPEIEEADLDDLSLDPSALKLKMSTLRVARDDASETFVIESLLRVEPDLKDEPFVNQPMAFPVFGRGRALYALVGDGITADTVREAGEFLTGACQCTVKAQNPGVDLLLAVDWDQHITPALPFDDTQPELAGLGSFADVETTEGTATVESISESFSEADATHIPSSTTAAVTPADAAPTSTAPSSVGSHAVPVNSAVPPEVASSLTGNVMLVVGLLAMCVIVATIVLIPRSR